MKGVSRKHIHREAFEIAEKRVAVTNISLHVFVFMNEFYAGTSTSVLS